MPRQVDHDQRRREILEAASRVLGERGMRALSFRSIAKELGGSTTLVTHYFSSQTELIRACSNSFAAESDEEVAALEEGIDDPHERLLVLLEWLVPSTEFGVVQERARIALLADRLSGEDVSENFDVWEEKTREMLRRHLKGLVPAKELEVRVEMLRVFTNGLTLSAIEHPELWSREHLISVLRQAVDDMGLLKATSRKRKALARA